MVEELLNVFKNLQGDLMFIDYIYQCNKNLYRTVYMLFLSFDMDIEREVLRSCPLK